MKNRHVLNKKEKGRKLREETKKTKEQIKGKKKRRKKKKPKETIENTKKIDVK